VHPAKAVYPKSSRHAAEQRAEAKRNLFEAPCKNGIASDLIQMSQRDHLFAEALAAGKAAAVAYQEAGFTGGAANARRKKASAKIKAMVAAILLQREQVNAQVTERLAETIVITRQSEIEAFKRLADKAESEGRYADALRAHELLGRSIGMFVERSVTVNLNADLDRVSDAELLDIVTGEGSLLALEAAPDTPQLN
jgi:hypothetical protein